MVATKIDSLDKWRPITYLTASLFSEKMTAADIFTIIIAQFNWNIHVGSHGHMLSHVFTHISKEENLLSSLVEQNSLWYQQWIFYRRMVSIRWMS